MFSLRRYIYIQYKDPTSRVCVDSLSKFLLLTLQYITVLVAQTEADGEVHTI